MTKTEMSDQNDKPNPCFTPSISKGFVSLTEKEDGKEITLLIDSAGSQSIIKAHILSLSSATFCHSSVKIRVVGMVNMRASLHRIHLHCPLFSGWFEVAVLPDLPVPGVFLLCNDIAGGETDKVVLKLLRLIMAILSEQPSPAPRWWSCPPRGRNSSMPIKEAESGIHLGSWATHSLLAA